MDAKELYDRMVAMKADSFDELNLIDEVDNLNIRIWKESDNTNGTGIYYRIRIEGYAGLICELLPDMVNDTTDGIQLYTAVDEMKENIMLCGILNVCKWEMVE